MRRYMVAAAVVVVLAAAVFGRGAWPQARAANCGDWGNSTADRISTARQLLYPSERQGQTTGSVQGDAQALYQLAQDQANSNPPDEGRNLSGDLVEAFSAGANALGGNGSSPDAQIAFAKSIVYNADLRVAYLLDGC